MWRAGRNTEAAFTLLEALVVLTVLSLVATAAALELPNARDRIRLAQARGWLESTLAHCGRQALREGRTISVEFDPAAGRYRVSGDDWRALPRGVVWTVEAAGQPEFSNPNLVFLSDGTGSGATIVMRAGSYSSVHRIAWLTGTIRDARN